ncbi:DUF4291 domain-containing protein [Tengunoibacter tsumagoiensis]|uniref:DUF4291 domain-containing protein n=1 Tax=Tengunoibacter tsumagoiensis TaxID=2014871 RepID=A0A401ZYX7_9CHLR|nr:DUF4291 domain-containing protein [Tengunoibacter tsumagoiensis]GCE12022.1 hypothetical protein KTT_18810 [Tengunoibacter tsumagoiensis]
MNIITEPYLVQANRWPQSGSQILAHYTDSSVIVYQAYRPGIGHFAARHHYFGGEFSLSRMSWIKPGFLWMMYRCGWASKEGQEVVLAIHLKRSAFDTILAQAVLSTYVETLYGSMENWKQALKSSSVRLQWDPDHDPSGQKCERRALQLGLRDEVLKQYARDWIIDIEDITPFVKQQSQFAREYPYQHLLVPQEKIYPILDSQLAKRLGMVV